MSLLEIQHKSEFVLFDSRNNVVAAINRGDVKDTEVEAIMDSIVDSLFSVFVTMGT